MNADTFWIVIPTLLIGLLALVASNTRSIRLAALRAEVQKALIARISTNAELQAYIEKCPALLSGHASGLAALEKALDAIRTGIILLAAGIAAGVWSQLDARFPVGIAFLVIALGVGFVAAGVSTRQLARRWGLLDSPKIPGGDPNAR